jgi:hypothetical protein
MITPKIKTTRRLKLAKEIILYNLKDSITDEEYADYVKNEKGPLLESLSSAQKFELVKITGAASGKIPYRYVGILHLKSLEDFYKNDAPSPKFQGFLEKWKTKVAEFHILSGEEIY